MHDDVGEAHGDDEELHDCAVVEPVRENGFGVSEGCGLLGHGGFLRGPVSGPEVIDFYCIASRPQEPHDERTADDIHSYDSQVERAAESLADRDGAGQEPGLDEEVAGGVEQQRDRARKSCNPGSARNEGARDQEGVVHTAHPDRELAAENGCQDNPAPADEVQQLAGEENGQIDLSRPGDLDRQPVDQAGDRR